MWHFLLPWSGQARPSRYHTPPSPPLSLNTHLLLLRCSCPSSMPGLVWPQHARPSPYAVIYDRPRCACRACSTLPLKHCACRPLLPRPRFLSRFPPSTPRSTLFSSAISSFIYPHTPLSALQKPGIWINLELTTGNWYWPKGVVDRR